MDRKELIQEEHSSRSRLFLAVACVNILYTSTGCVMSWTSPTLPKLKGIISEDEGSMIGAIYSFGAAFCPIIIFLCLDTLGRKAILYIAASCFLISWIVLGISTNIYVLCIGRIIGGIGVGGTFSGAPAFITEIADNKARGAVSSISQATLAIGFLIEYAVGPYTNYITLVAISAVPVLLFMLVFPFIPESPYFLLMKDRRNEAEDSLRWFRGCVSSDSVQKELIEMEDSLSTNKGETSGATSIFQRGPLRAMFIGFYLLLIQQGTGNNAIVSFAEHIFDLAHIPVSGSVCAIIGACTNIVGGCLLPFIVGKFSMRKTFLGSTFGLALSLGLLAAYFYIESTGAYIANIAFLPLIAYIMYNVFYSWGCGPLPWPMAAELFPVETKKLLTCICGIFSCLFGFAAIKIFAILLTHLGPAMLFLLICIYITLTISGAVFLIPDTAGLSLQEIHAYLSTGERTKKSSSQA